MPNLKKIKINNSNIFDIFNTDNLLAGTNIGIVEYDDGSVDLSTLTYGVEYILGTQSSATNVWLGTSTDLGCNNGTLYNGKVIIYHLPYNGNTSSATLNLTLADNSTTGPINVKYLSGTNVTNEFSAGYDIFMIYDGTLWKTSASGTSKRTLSIPFAKIDSTSTATAYTATVPGITELVDGTCVMLENGVITSAAGFTLNINGLGAKPVFNNLTAATRDTTIFNVNYTMLFVYDSNRVVDGITGAWCCYRGYDAQIQADWNQTTTTAKDYIKNKPDIVQTDSPTKEITILSTSNSNKIKVGDSVSIGRNGANISIGSQGGDNETIRLTSLGNDGGVYVSTDTKKFYYNDKEVAVKDDIKVTSVNGQTGDVNLTIPDDNTLVHRSGNEPVGGQKTFSSTIVANGGIDVGQGTVSSEDSQDFNYITTGGGDTLQDALDLKASKADAIGSLSLSIDNDYKVTLSGTKVNGTPFTVLNVIDLPLESVVVNGSYNNTTKKVILTLQNDSTIEFSVADLISGLQSEITSSNKLSADLILDGTTNKVYTATEKTKLAGIASGAEVNVLSDWNVTDTSSDAFIKNKPNIPSAPGTLNTTATTALATSSSEALSGNITLHKISKTGTYSDLIGTPTFKTINSLSITGTGNIIAGGENIISFTSTGSSSPYSISNASTIYNSISTVLLNNQVPILVGNVDGSTIVAIMRADSSEYSGYYVSSSDYYLVRVGSSSGTVTVTSFKKLSSNYLPSTLTNDDLRLEAGDHYNIAFGKLEKAILDDEKVVSKALTDINTETESIKLNVTLINQDLSNKSNIIEIIDLT